MPQFSGRHVRALQCERRVRQYGSPVLSRVWPATGGSAHVSDARRWASFEHFGGGFLSGASCAPPFHEIWRAAESQVEFHRDGEQLSRVNQDAVRLDHGHVLSSLAIAVFDIAYEPLLFYLPLRDSAGVSPCRHDVVSKVDVVVNRGARNVMALFPESSSNSTLIDGCLSDRRSPSCEVVCCNARQEHTVHRK